MREKRREETNKEFNKTASCKVNMEYLSVSYTHTHTHTQAWKNWKMKNLNSIYNIIKILMLTDKFNKTCTRSLH